jgi:hypothetical protein
MHVEQVLGGVPVADRCRCREERAKTAGAATSSGPKAWLKALLGK